MTTDPIDYSSFTQLIADHQSFVITTHLNPDGDALGSEIGLAEWMRSIGKSVRVVNHSPIPFNYHFLNEPHAWLEQFDSATHDQVLQDADAILVLDVNDPERTKSLGPYLRANRKPVAVIDHHLEPKQFATSYFVDTEASSTGEMIFRMVLAGIPSLGGRLSTQAAMALYVAIMTDTGGFKFPRTDAELFRICAELLELGADPVVAYNEVYNTSPATRLLLMRECLNSLEYHHDNQMALQVVTQAQLAKVGSLEEDVDGFVQMPFQVKGILLSVFLLELKTGWKLSARSKGDVSAAKLAQHFGGNGHFNAAGARVYEEKTLDMMKSEIIHMGNMILP